MWYTIGRFENVVQERFGQMRRMIVGVVLLALVGLVLSARFVALTALAVWLVSGHPILYRQERVGENGRLFTLYKFRSMRKDAEQGTPIWAQEEDDRVTRVGRFIRQTRLDELPQRVRNVRSSSRNSPIRSRSTSSATPSNRV